MSPGRRTSAGRRGCKGQSDRRHLGFSACRSARRSVASCWNGYAGVVLTNCARFAKAGL